MWTLDEFIRKFRPTDDNAEFFDEGLEDIRRTERKIALLNAAEKVAAGFCPMGHDGLTGQWLEEQARVQ